MEVLGAVDDSKLVATLTIRLKHGIEIRVYPVAPLQGRYPRLGACPAYEKGRLLQGFFGMESGNDSIL